MKVAIIGSREYENARKIKDTLTELKRRFGDKLIIISGGAQHGADKFARKFALENDWSNMANRILDVYDELI